MTKQEQRALDRWARREWRRLNTIDWPAAVVGWLIVLGALYVLAAIVPPGAFDGICAPLESCR
jgi:hypothetical protein